ncbi:MAG: PIN domain-containing protein [Anaerolineae bacterium]|nr:PIN domain-containing protein [Anaerolineae bacterium]NIN93562.1 PIN domain-containing protein [Anaerolineae bacterium]NIQ76645.1 PIN domain-containing protein [Anaerolineae bacterium]
MLRRGIRGELTIVVSRYVLEEVRRSLEAKAARAVDAYEEFVSLLAPEITPDASHAELKEAASYVNLKDAPVVAAAVRAEVEYLVTLDRRHLMRDSVVGRRSGLNIITPEQLLTILRDDG